MLKEDLDNDFGLGLLKIEKVKVDSDVMKLVKERNKARKDKD